MLLIQSLLMFCHLSIVHVARLQIDGLINIGPELNYKVQISEMNEGKVNLALRMNNSSNSIALTTSSSLRTHKTKIPDIIDANSKSKKNTEAVKEFTTKINISFTFDSSEDDTKTLQHTNYNPNKGKSRKKVKLQNEMPRQRAKHQPPHKIRDDESILKYFNHLYNRALNVIDSLSGGKNTKKYRSTLHKVKHMYKEKIHEFVLNVENQTLRTKLGRQKALLNTLYVSNKIINKLLDRMDIPLAKSLTLRTGISSTNAIQDRIAMDEYYFICTEYNICRSEKSFSDLLVEILSVILSKDNRDVKQASDALTEVFNGVNFPKIMRLESQKKFKKIMEKLEKMEPVGTRVVFTILKNMITNRNEPIKIYGNENLALVNKTIAFQTIVNEFDLAMPGSKDNVKNWENLLRDVQHWANGDRSRIMDVFGELLKIIEKGVENMTEHAAQKVRKNVLLVLN